MIDQKIKAMNIADMHAEELQQVARIVHKALGWSMIPPGEVIYAREMVQELADSYAKEKSANINALRKDEAFAVFDSFIERFNLEELLKFHIEEGRANQ